LVCIHRKGIPSKGRSWKEGCPKTVLDHKKEPLPGILNIIYYVYENFKANPTERNTKREEKDIVHTHPL
jgi:hypothetical protein